MNLEIERRKRDHIDAVLNENVTAKGATTGFERLYFEHVALPEIDLDDVETGCAIFGKQLAAPLLLSSMTGGTDIAKKINSHLAEAAQEMGIAMGVGSQRAAIVDTTHENTFRIRSLAPDILLFANLGAVQFNYGFTVEQARKAVDMIEADGLFLHLNPLQEAVQTEGDRNWSGVLNKIGELVEALDTPVVVKEVGNGISAGIARRLVDLGVSGIDVAGAGGTSWSEVEAYRQNDEQKRRIAHSFAGWGIPTSIALSEVRRALPDTPLIASGGIRSGVDVAKAIRLGADLVGMAAPTLAPAIETTDVVIAQMAAVAEELRVAMFCTGSAHLTELRQATILDDRSALTL
ncbi:MAG: type 2 isopentenyl-diphosphate Delta-isomerase [Pseudomonadota bacterium]|nr:type 2 isopentenyl-diphosphate Delta-isomerase [Pseudomonadota bacterium]